MRIAFIGGNGHHLLRALLQETSLTIDAVANASDGYDAERSRAMTKPDSEWFDDARQMLETFKPDVVNVGAVYAHNNEWIIECVERGIPVVSDKPIAATWEGYERLKQAVARHRQARVITEFTFRSDPAIRAARDAIAAGRIGDVVLASGQKSYRFNTRPKWYADRNEYGGTILWVAGHAIDFVRFATGMPYVRAFGRQANISKPEYGSMEEATVSVLELANGAPAVVHADYNRPTKAPTHGDDRLRVVGAIGQVEVRDHQCILTTHEQEPLDITGQARPRPASLEMLDALHGDESIYGTAQSMEMAKVLLTCRDAADQQRQIDIPA